MKPMTDPPGAEAIAAEFLDQWEKVHSGGTPDQADYARLATRYAIYTGQVSLGEAGEAEEALRADRIARGWPDPRPAPSGSMSTEPTIEAAIMML
jgi:hypothetical protein